MQNIALLGTRDVKWKSLAKCMVPLHFKVRGACQYNGTWRIARQCKNRHRAGIKSVSEVCTITVLEQNSKLCLHLRITRLWTFTGHLPRLRDHLHQGGQQHQEERLLRRGEEPHQGRRNVYQGKMISEIELSVEKKWLMKKERIFWWEKKTSLGISEQSFFFAFVSESRWIKSQENLILESDFVA